jgi:hypothetical protein
LRRAGLIVTTAALLGLAYTATGQEEARRTARRQSTLGEEAFIGPSGTGERVPLVVPGQLKLAPGADVGLGGTREPTIAVDPSNPLNIAYASLFELRVSNDGGATWSPGLGVAGTPLPFPLNTDEDGDGLDGEDPVEPGRDNDLDGSVDEDPLNGIDDDGDGRIDEDPAVSIDNDGDGLFDEDPWYPNQAGDPSVAYDSQGRLFWTFLWTTRVRWDTNGNGTLDANGTAGIDVGIAGIDPTTGAVLAGYPVNITESAGVGMPGVAGNLNDKEWIAIDCKSAAFQDRIHVVWVNLTGTDRILTTYSDDQGLTWSATVQHSAADGSEGFVWPPHITTALNGDVYVAYHSQPNFVLNAPDGVSGQTFLSRSTDGGVTFAVKTMPYSAGQSDMTFNVQVSTTTAIPNTQFWLQGSVQPWVLADPNDPNNLWVVVNDDPDDDPTSGDAADVFITRTTDGGFTWSAPTRVDSGPEGTFQVMPTAGIDPQTGCIVVTYFDNRNDNTNAAGNFLLDLYITASRDGGVTFIPDAQLNDVAFDPDPGSGCRFNCTPNTDNDGDGLVDEDPIDGINNDGDAFVDEDPPDIPTRRIGEYNGVALGGCNANAVWVGNNGALEQTIFDSTLAKCDVEPPVIVCPPDLVLECDQDTSPANAGTATATDVCDPDPDIVYADNEIPGTCPQALTILRTWTATDDAGNQGVCTQTITVVDTTPPEVFCPSDVVVSCGAPTDPGSTGTATASDNCDTDPDVAYFDVVVPSSCLADPVQETIERTWVATDACGNATACLQTITVLRLDLELDIKPESCPNAYNLRGRGVFPVSLLGTVDLDVTQIDPATVRISRQDCVGGAVAPLRWSLEDNATPYTGDPCGCHTLGGDGYVDLALKFKHAEVTTVLELDSFAAGTEVPLVVSGTLMDGCEFIATDCILITPNVQEE